MLKKLSKILLVLTFRQCSVFCDEELEDKENYQLNSDITNKYKRRWNIGGSSRNNSQLGTMSLRSSSYQHSLLKNKNTESVANPAHTSYHTSLQHIPELSFTKTESSIENPYNAISKRPYSDRKTEEKKIFVVDREKPAVPSESQLLCNEDLDIGLMSQDPHNDFSVTQNFGSILNPELMGIPSDISNFDKLYKSEASSNLRGDEGFEEFMRWGNKFAFDSNNNSPLGQSRTNDNMSFTFTKRDEKSPQREPKSEIEDSKFEQVEVEE